MNENTTEFDQNPMVGLWVTTFPLVTTRTQATRVFTVIPDICSSDLRVGCLAERRNMILFYRCHLHTYSMEPGDNKCIDRTPNTKYLYYIETITTTRSINNLQR